MPRDDRPDTQHDEAYTNLLQEFQERRQVPRGVRKLYNTFAKLREYVFDKSLHLEDEDIVATNYILRTQLVNLAQLDRKPEVDVRASRVLLDDSAQGTPARQLDGQAKFAETAEIFLRHVLERMMRVVDVLPELEQEAMTVPIAWVKVVYNEDPTKDPLGMTYQDPMHGRLLRYQQLREDFDNDQFSKDDDEYAEMLDLAQTLKSMEEDRLLSDMAANPLEPIEKVGEDGTVTVIEADDPRAERVKKLRESDTFDDIPEFSFFQGFNLQLLYAEDVRYDWDVTRLSDVKNGNLRWIEDRIWMTRDEIIDFAGTDDQDVIPISEEQDPAPKQRNTSTPNEARAATDATTTTELNGTYPVWETHDLVTGTIYWSIEGAKKFIRVERPDVETRRKHPYFPLVFNTAAGRIEGVSDVMLQMHLQDEINRRRTIGSEMLDSAAPRFVAPRGAFTDEELHHMQFSDPWDVILTERMDAHNLIHEIAPTRVDPRLSDTSMPRVELEMMSGTPGSGLGGTGQANFATEEAIANEQMGLQSARRAKLIELLLTDVCEYVLQIALQTFPIDVVRAIVGPGATWPFVDLNTLLHQLKIDINVSLRGGANPEQLFQPLQLIMQFFRENNIPYSPIEAAKKLGKALDLRGEIAEMVIPVTPEQDGALGGAALEQTQPSAGGNGQGPGRGGQPMQEPPSPSSVPNDPTG